MIDENTPIQRAYRACWNKGWHAFYREEGKYSGGYRRKDFRSHFAAGWEQAENEKIASDLSDSRSFYSLINPRNPFFGKPPIEIT
jgi:hypothetical protein